jgi:hypothetical protein
MVTGQPGPCVGNIEPIERLGFNGLCLQDGPLSNRVADYVSVFSAGVSSASTWDRDILYERGLLMGKEFRAKGAHVALSPVAGPLGRSAYSGRNWEGFSPDPYLTGIGMYQTIKGHQDAGVQATAKHFIGNEQETQRNPSKLALVSRKEKSMLTISQPTPRMPLSTLLCRRLSRPTWTTGPCTSSTSGLSPTLSRLALPLSCARTRDSTALMPVRTARLRTVS